MVVSSMGPGPNLPTSAGPMGIGYNPANMYGCGSKSCQQCYGPGAHGPEDIYRNEQNMYVSTNGKIQQYPINEPNKKMVKTLGTMMKKLLDKDTQVLVKAGYINGDLELTQEGKDMLWTMAFDANKAALVTAAQAKIDDEVAKNK